MAGPKPRGSGPGEMPQARDQSDKERGSVSDNARGRQTPSTQPVAYTPVKDPRNLQPLHRSSNTEVSLHWHNGRNHGTLPLVLRSIYSYPGTSRSCLNPDSTSISTSDCSEETRVMVSNQKSVAAPFIFRLSTELIRRSQQDSFVGAK